MGVKRSFKQILALMVSSRTYIRSLSVVLTVIMALQLAVVSASAAQWTKEPQKEIESVVSEDTTEGDVVDPTALESETKPTEPALKNTTFSSRKSAQKTNLFLQIMTGSTGTISSCLMPESL